MKRIKCPKCFGKNKEDRECDPAIPPCSECKGTGTIPEGVSKHTVERVIQDLYIPKKAEEGSFYNDSNCHPEDIDG